jgi:3-oxoacyl-[acyl-carrier protein] reductase
LLILTQEFVKYLISVSRGGTIVNTASVAGRIYANGVQVDYGASKAGVINLTKSLGRELAQYNIRVNAIAPSVVNAGMGANLTGEVKEQFLAVTPMGRVAEPGEVASVVSFLVSDDASYLTGITVEIDGGL